jgi:hypothetical protein
MKRLLYSMTAASVAAVVALASSSPVRASDKPTADPAQNTAGNEPNVPAQNASPAKAKRNHDSHSKCRYSRNHFEGIRRGCLLQTREAGQRELSDREHLSGRDLLICLVGG